MSWYDWLILAVCVTGYATAWRLVFRWMVNDSYGLRLDWGDVVLNAVAATLAACFFPFILAAALVRACWSGDDPEEFARIVGGESRVDKRERHERELRDHEQWIARKERELGIVPSSHPHDFDERGYLMSDETLHEWRLRALHEWRTTEGGPLEQTPRFTHASSTFIGGGGTKGIEVRHYEDAETVRRCDLARRDEIVRQLRGLGATGSRRRMPARLRTEVRDRARANGARRADVDRRREP